MRREPNSIEGGRISKATQLATPHGYRPPTSPRIHLCEAQLLNSDQNRRHNEAKNLHIQQHVTPLHMQNMPCIHSVPDQFNKPYKLRDTTFTSTCRYNNKRMPRTTLTSTYKSALQERKSHVHSLVNNANRHTDMYTGTRACTHSHSPEEDYNRRHTNNDTHIHKNIGIHTQMHQHRHTDTGIDKPAD